MSYLGPSSVAEQADILARLLPDGKLWKAKFIKESNLYRLLLGFGGEFLRVHQSIEHLVCNYLINRSDAFLEQWEAALGIPDDCFPGTGTREARVQHVLIKLAALNVITEADWINLAKILGFNICIENGAKCGIYPLCYPINYYSDAREARFTLVVYIEGKPGTVYPLPYPIQYASGADNLLKCILNKVKPQDTVLRFQFVETLPC